MTTPYKVHLKNVHPGVGMPHLGGFYAPLNDKKVRINSYAEAQRKVLDFIDRYELGASAWAGGDIFDKSGKYLGYVSYNGRLWKGKKRTNPMSERKGSAVSPQEVAHILHKSPSEKPIKIGGLTAYWGTDGDYDMSAGTSRTGEPLGFFLGVTVLETSHPLTFPKQVLLALAKKMQASVVRGTVRIDPQEGEAGAIVKPQKTKKNPPKRGIKKVTTTKRKLTTKQNVRLHADKVIRYLSKYPHDKVSVRFTVPELHDVAMQPAAVRSAIIKMLGEDNLIAISGVWPFPDEDGYGNRLYQTTAAFKRAIEHANLRKKANRITKARQSTKTNPPKAGRRVNRWRMDDGRVLTSDQLKRLFGKLPTPAQRRMLGIRKEK